MSNARRPSEKKIAKPDAQAEARVEIQQKLLGWTLRGEHVTPDLIARIRDMAPEFDPPYDRVVANIGLNADAGLEVSPASIAFRMAKDPGLVELGAIDHLLALAQSAPVVLRPQEIETAVRTCEAMQMRERIRARTDRLVQAVSADEPDAAEHAVALQRLLSQSDTARGPRIRLVPFDEIKLSPQPRYRVAGILPSVGLGVAWGPPKSGKTFWAFDLVMHVALGWEYRGRRVEQGPVVYCAFEGQGGIEARVAVFRQTSLRDHGEPVPFYLEDVRLDLVADHLALIAAVQRQLPAETTPAVVVLDTVNRSLRGSESSDEDMSAYVNAADAIKEAFQCSVLLIHHCGVEGTRPRGHTSLTGAADVQLSVKRDAADNVIVEVELAKDGPQGDKIVSTLEAVEVGRDLKGDPITSCVIVPSDDAPAARKVRVTGAASVALDLLRKAIAEAPQQAPATPHIPRDIGTTTVSMWRTYFYQGTAADHDKRDTQKTAFRRASLKLQSVGVIGIWGEFVWIV